MSVKYRKVKNNRQGSSTLGKIYGRAVVNDVVSTKKIAEKIGKRCTVTEPDILAVINALETEIADNLALGNRVVLDGFGSFKVGLTTSPAESAKKFTAANIKGMHIIFAPAIEMDQGKRIKSMLRGVKVEEMTEYARLGDEDDDKGGTSSGGGNGGGSGSTDNPGSGSSDSGGTGGSDTGDSGSSGGESGGSGSGGNDVGLDRKSVV